MNTQSLLKQAQSLSGKSFLQVAQLCHIPTPCQHSRTNQKGWLGQTLEIYLGATAGSKPLPDFIELGIELKTIPILPDGTPKESTYICTAPIPIRDASWADSRVFNKLKKVLWFPYFYDKKCAFENQLLGTPLLWAPNELQMLKLQNDWEELVELINFGKIEGLSAHIGECLQIRPKASRSNVQIPIINHEGELFSTTPKGFYLRKTFTKEIISSHYIF